MSERRQSMVTAVLLTALALSAAACGGSSASSAPAIHAATVTSTVTRAAGRTQAVVSRSSTTTVTGRATGAASTLHGQSARQDFFESPTGNIACELDNNPSAGLVNADCQTTSPPESVTLTPGGRVTTCRGTRCLGNGPEDSYTLPYGAATVMGPYRCVSTEAQGVECRRLGGGGFEISKSGIRQL